MAAGVSKDDSTHFCANLGYFPRITLLLMGKDIKKLVYWFYGDTNVEDLTSLY